MRDYGKVSPQFWTGATGRKIRALGANVQVVALYLMTCPSSSMIGLYYLPLPMLAHETGIPLEGACKALRSLSEVGFAEYDEANEIVLVHAMARHQIGERVVKADKRHLGVTREAQKLTYSSLFAKWYARYREPYDLPDMSHASPLEAPSKPLRSQDQDQEHGQDHEQGDARGAIAPAPPPAAGTASGAHSTSTTTDPAPPKRRRTKPAPQPDTLPMPGTLARRVFDAITGDRALCPIVGNPGDASERWADPATFPGVDVLAEVMRAGEYAATKPGRYTDGRAFLRRWLQRKADEVAAQPKPAAPAPHVAPVPANRGYVPKTIPLPDYMKHLARPA